MEIARIRVSGVKAELERTHAQRWDIPAGIVGATIRFSFDEIWAKLSKTVVFCGNGITKDVVNVTDVLTVPAEVVAKAERKLLVGVYGVDAAGETATPTLWVEGYVRSATDPSGDTTTDPVLPVWAQMEQRVETVEKKMEILETEANSIASIEATTVEGDGRRNQITITLDDGTQTYFSVANGSQGQQGPQGPKGPQGEPGTDGTDGITPHIGENGSWWIGETDTGVSAAGDVSDARIADAVGNYLEENPVSGSSVFYVATDYGISADAQDNTPAMQALVDTISSKGGGIIFFPVGTYNFKKADTKYAILMKSNVSIMGENMEKTVLKQVDGAPYSLFYRFGSATGPLTGCSFQNFTVDAYATGSTNQVYGKAFFFQYLKDCVFRDLILKGTIATAMGIDYLDRVVIDNVSCIDCGRTYTGSQAGTSGIGIGTGGWEHENFTISNCVCVGSGQFGIFIENQHALGWGGNVDYSKGCVIANCVVRGGLNHGIGIRGGENVTVIGCEVYENAKHGFYLDNKCRNVRILSCSATKNGGSGIYMTPNTESARITVKGCGFVDNAGKGILVAAASDKLCISECYTDGNEVGLHIGSLSLNDCVLWQNALLDGNEVSAGFTGNTQYNPFGVAIAPTGILAENVAVTEGNTVKLNYAVTPSNADGSVNFVSSDPEIAEVDEDGNVTGIAEGSCQISITSVVEPTVTATVSCSVSAASTVILPTAITAGDVELTEGETAALTYTVLPTGASGEVSFASDDEAVAKVGENGVVTAVGAGTCKITITSVAAPDVYTEISCTVSAQSVAADIYLTQGDLIREYKIMPDGSVANQSNGNITDYLDVSGLGDSFTITWEVATGGPVYGMRIAQYDENKGSLSSSFSLTSVSGTSANVTKLSGCKYIRVFLSTNNATTYNYVKLS